MQVGDVQVQRAGGRRPVALMSRQRAGNRLALEIIRGFAQIDVAHRRRRCHLLGRQRRRRRRKLKMLRLQYDVIASLGSPRQHHRPVNGMLQFTHVARPRPLLQPATRCLT